MRYYLFAEMQGTTFCRFRFTEDPTPTSYDHHRHSIGPLFCSDGPEENFEALQRQLKAVNDNFRQLCVIMKCLPLTEGEIKRFIQSLLNAGVAERAAIAEKDAAGKVAVVEKAPTKKAAVTEKAAAKRAKK